MARLACTWGRGVATWDSWLQVVIAFQTSAGAVVTKAGVGAGRGASVGFCCFWNNPACRRTASPYCPMALP
jgi:hypothetical protein